ncbi:MAG: hypothetical protein WD648_04350, partial [Planctomycetaceae bacterium]
LKLAGRLDPTYETMLNVMTTQIGVLISNPKVDGVDPKGDWFMVIFSSGSAGPPAVAFGIPFSDEQKLKSATVGNFTFVKHEKYLFYSEDDSAAQKIQSRVKDEGQSIVSQIDRASQALMNRCDLSIYLNMKQVNEQYKPVLDIASEEIDKAINEWKTLVPAEPELDLEPVFGMYGEMAHAVLQAVRDTEGYAFGVEASLRGANIEQYVRLASGSSTDIFLQSQTTSDMKDLERLPADKLMYFALHGDFTALTQWSTKFATAMMQDEEDKKAMQEALAVQSKIKYSGYQMSFGLGSPEQGALQMTMVTKAEPTDLVREMTRKTATLMQKMNLGGGNQKLELELKPDAEKYGRYNADVLTMKIETEKAENDPFNIQEQMDKMMTAMYGPDGMTQRIVYTGDRTIQTLGGGKDTMEEALKALDAVRPTDAKSSPLQQTRAALPEKTNMLFFIDVPGLATRAATLLLEGAQGSENMTFQFPIDAEALKGLDIKPSYLGSSLTVGTASIASTTYIPIEQIEGINKLIGLFRSATPAPAQP